MAQAFHVGLPADCDLMGFTCIIHQLRRRLQGNKRGIMRIGVKNHTQFGRLTFRILSSE